ncbi:hypothetical protein BC940DRAFT_304320, partial [Gongronella butleri]
MKKNQGKQGKQPTVLRADGYGPPRSPPPPPPTLDEGYTTSSSYQSSKKSGRSNSFMKSVRRAVRDAAGVDAPFVNPYLGPGHLSHMLPPLGKTRIEPSVGYEISPMVPPPMYPPPYGPPPRGQRDDEDDEDDDLPHMPYPYHHPYAGYMMPPVPPMYPPYSNMYPANYPMQASSMMMPHNTFMGHPPLHPYPCDPYMYSHPFYSGYPYATSALPVQDKRLLPERNYISSIKDIWKTNL